MTFEQLRFGNALADSIESLRWRLDKLTDEESPFGIPKDMLDRHLQEIREYLEAELARLQASFAAL